MAEDHFDANVLNLLVRFLQVDFELAGRTAVDAFRMLFEPPFIITPPCDRTRLACHEFFPAK